MLSVDRFRGSAAWSCGVLVADGFRWTQGMQVERHQPSVRASVAVSNLCKKVCFWTFSQLSV